MLGAKGGSTPSPHDASHFFVQFHETPNEECMKFFVEGQHFLLPADVRGDASIAPKSKPVDITKKRVLIKTGRVGGSAATPSCGAEELHPRLVNLVSEEAFEGGSHHAEQYAEDGTAVPPPTAFEEGKASSPPTPSHLLPMTMAFDRSNSFLSPLAQVLMDGCPMIEEVTVGHSFITVRRISEEELVEKLKEAEAQEVKQVDLFKGAPVKKTPPPQHEEAQQNEPLPSSPAASSQPPTATQRNDDGAVKEMMWEEKEKSPSCSPPAPSPLSANVDVAESQSHTGSSPKMNEDAVQSEKAVDDDGKYQAAAHSALSWGELQFTVSALLMDHLFTGAPHITPGAPHPHPDTLPAEGDSEVMLVIKELVSDVIRPLVQQDGGDVRLIRFEPLGEEEALASDNPSRTPPSSSPESQTECVSSLSSSAACPVSPNLPAPESTLSERSSSVGPAEQGRVWIEMLGACRSCKSSKTTLKDLIERTLQHWVPEVREVVEFDAAAKEKAQRELKDAMQRAYEARRATTEAVAAAVTAKEVLKQHKEARSEADSKTAHMHPDVIPEIELP